MIILQSGGNGVQTFKLENVLGSYDGLFNIKEVPAPNQFVIGSDFNIPARRYEFNETQINATTNIISLQNPHNLITGEKLIYDNNGQDSIFEDEIEEYYAIAVNATDFKIAESNLSAVNNQNVSLIASSGDQSFISKNVIKAFNGIGTLKTIEGSKVLVGNGSRFLRTFKRFDTILIQGPNFIQAFTIDVITTEERLIVFENIPFTANDVNYFFPSQMILRPDGFGLHKPFDGGVDITAGTSPNSKIVRQTRKYFRYQSGKGIQNSYAINFNPPKEIQRLRSGGGTTAVVECEVLHRLRVGDNIEIVGAETNTDVNPYLGRFIVSEVTNPFIFQYEMNSEPEESFAGGFPAYIRSS